MTVDELPLLELFTRLRQAGLPLGMDEYHLLLRALQAGFGIPDRAALARLCCSLWIKSVEDKRLFDYHFEQVMANDAASVGTVLDQRPLFPASEGLQNNKTDQRRRKIAQLVRYIVRARAFILGVGIILAGAYLLFGINHSPKFTSLPPEKEAKVGEEYIYEIQAKDFDKNDILTITAPNLPVWLTLADKGKGTAILRGTFTPEANQGEIRTNNLVTLQVTDNHGAKDIQSFEINQATDGINQATEPIPIWFFLLPFVALILGYIIFRWIITQNTNVLVRVGNYFSFPRPIRSNTASIPPLELKPQVEDQVPVSKPVGHTTRKKTKHFRSRFIETDEYFPLTRRQMKQSWRYLRQMVREGSPIELDVEATVKQIGRLGLLLKPVLVPRRVNRTELLLLIDRDGSMLPFHSLSDRLAQTAVGGGRLHKADIYYFHNCAIEYLYHDPYHQKAKLISDVLAGLQSQNAGVLFFSDAGAARGGYNPERLELTAELLERLKQRVRYLAWINPVPRSRWGGTTAAEIARLVPMFEVSRRGLDNAISVLRGQFTYYRG